MIFGYLYPALLSFLSAMVNVLLSALTKATFNNIQLSEQIIKTWTIVFHSL